MAVSITNKHTFFNNGNDVIILFKSNSNIDQNINFKKEGDFQFIISNNNVIGINIFNFNKYFNIEEGFHLLNNQVKEYLLKNFSGIIKKENFDSFFKIGEVLEIKTHPQNDKLKILNVNFRDGKRQIITNVQTIKNNNKYLFATNGATTATGLNIINSKIMNVQSEGMIMSYKSLGQNNDEIIDCNKYDINDEFSF